MEDNFFCTGWCIGGSLLLHPVLSSSHSSFCKKKRVKEKRKLRKPKFQYVFIIFVTSIHSLFLKLPILWEYKLLFLSHENASPLLSSSKPEFEATSMTKFYDYESLASSDFIRFFFSLFFFWGGGLKIWTWGYSVQN